MFLKRKDAHISEIQTNLGRANNVINFLEARNKKLETEKTIYEIRAMRARKKARKAKAKLDETLGTFDEDEEEEEQLPRRRPRKIGLKKALAKEREQEVGLAKQLIPSELLSLEIGKDKESLLDRANLHLERLLEKANKDNDIQWKMAKHYAMMNKIVRAKLK